MPKNLLYQFIKKTINIIIMIQKIVHYKDLWSLAFTLLLSFFVPSISFAEQPQLVSWDELAALEILEDSQRSNMSLSQKEDLRTVMLLQEAIKSGHYAQTEIENGSKALKRLQNAGFNVQKLLNDEMKVSKDINGEKTQINWNIINKKVLIDGYILPLVWKNETVIEFLIVPWVGACIHTPAPQSNQIIHVLYPSGLNIQKQYQSFRLSGVLKHRPAEHELFLIDGSRHISASYALEDSQISGSPSEIKASSVSELPIWARIRIQTNLLFSKSMSSIAEGYSIKNILFAFLLAFGYGALHTLSPGHGKTVIISYFVGTGGNLIKGLLMGVRIAVIHVFSAVLLVLGLHLFFKQSLGATPSDFYFIKLASYALISLVGVAMFFQAISAYRTSKHSTSNLSLMEKPKSHELGHHDQSTCRTCQTINGSDNHSNFVATAVGIVPCTGALLVMLFGLANDLVFMAVMMVMAISAGMAVSMAIIGVTALLGRSWAEQQFELNSAKRMQFMLGSRFVGAFCVLAIGLTLMLITFIHNPIL